MANYNEYKTADQKVTNNIGFTFDTLSKFPVIAKRIWGTLADAQAWVDDADQAAVAGLVLTVVNDGINNGVYFVKSIGDGTNPGSLEKLSLSESTGDVQKALSDLTSAVGAASPSALTENLKDTNYLSGSSVDSVSDALVALDEALKATKDAIPLSASQLINDANYATSGYVDSKAEEASGAAQSWVNEQHYATTGEVETAIVTASAAAQSWVSEQHYATTGEVETAKVAASAAAKSWVEEQNYLSGLSINDNVLSKSATAVTLDSDDIKIGDYTATTYNTAFTAYSSVETGQTLGQAFKAVETTISGVVENVIANEKVDAAAVTALSNSLGIPDGSEIKYYATTSATYISAATSYSDADAKLDSAIKALADSMSTGSVHSVTAGDDIVSITGTTDRVVSVKSANLDIVGANAITVTKQADDTGLDVALKLGTQPASGESGVVLAQDDNGLTASIQWGTF